MMGGCGGDVLAGYNSQMMGADASSLLAQAAGADAAAAGAGNMNDMLRMMMAALGQGGSGATESAATNALLLQAGLQMPGGCNPLLGVGGCGAVPAVESRSGGKGQTDNAPRKNMPEGSWICLACHNVNFPNRDTCNKRVCGRPRSEVDGGPPPGTAGAHAQKKSDLPPPDGSWACAACGNVNWPLRTTCNRKTCGHPRDAPAPAPAPSVGPPPLPPPPILFAAS